MDKIYRIYGTDSGILFGISEREIVGILIQLTLDFSKDDNTAKLALNSGFIEGLKSGVRKFAWWKDGIQYCGTCGTTLKKALEDIDKEFADTEKLLGL